MQRRAFTTTSRAMIRASLLAPVALGAACTVSATGDLEGDAGVNESGGPDAMPPLPDDLPSVTVDEPGEPPTESAPGGTISLTQNASYDLNADLIANCNHLDDDELIAHAENRYFRVFDLASHAIQGDFLVENIVIGVALAEGSEDCDAGGDGCEQPLLFSVGAQPEPGAPVPEQADVDQFSVRIPDLEDDHVRIEEFNRVIPEGSALYVELEVPDGEDALGERHNLFLAGMNDDDEAEATYFSSPGCDGIELQPLGDVEAFDGEPRRWVVSVEGVAVGDAE